MMILADYGARKQGVASLPLALVLVLHLILVLLWASNGRKQIDQGAEQRHFAVTWIHALRPQKAPLPPPRAPEVAAPVVKRLPATAPSLPQAAPTTDPETFPGQADIAQPGTATATATSAPGATEMIDAAKRQAGLIDNQLRGGKPAPLMPDADLPIARLRSALESAFIDGSRTMVTDSQTQPDGVIVYRFRRGGKVWCRQSGGGGPSMIEHSDGAKLAGAGSRGGAGMAGNVQCPSGESGWSRL
ncbi:MAG: hypothetical protein WKG03_19860 [Telluria sp.]